MHEAVKQNIYVGNNSYITGNTCNLTNLRQKRLEDTTASTKTKSTASSEVKN